MPYVKDKDGNVVEKNYGNCIFLCVNPNSENLKNTLSYISNLCLYMMQQKDNPLNKNSESVLKEIYKMELWCLRCRQMCFGIVI